MDRMIYVGMAGAKNAGLLAVRILANSRPELRTKLRKHQDDQAADVRSQQLNNPPTL